MDRAATVAHLYRGDTITGIDGVATVAPETVTGLEFDTYSDTATVTTRCGTASAHRPPAAGQHPGNDRPAAAGVAIYRPTPRDRLGDHRRQRRRVRCRRSPGPVDNEPATVNR